MKSRALFFLQPELFTTNYYLTIENPLPDLGFPITFCIFYIVDNELLRCGNEAGKIIEYRP